MIEHQHCKRYINHETTNLLYQIYHVLAGHAKQISTIMIKNHKWCTICVITNSHYNTIPENIRIYIKTGLWINHKKSNWKNKYTIKIPRKNCEYMSITIFTKKNSEVSFNRLVTLASRVPLVISIGNMLHSCQNDTNCVLKSKIKFCLLF